MRQLKMMTLITPARAFFWMGIAILFASDVACQNDPLTVSDVMNDTLKNNNTLMQEILFSSMVLEMTDMQDNSSSSVQQSMASNMTSAMTDMLENSSTATFKSTEVTQSSNVPLSTPDAFQTSADPIEPGTTVTSPVGTTTNDMAQSTPSPVTQAFTSSLNSDQSASSITITPKPTTMVMTSQPNIMTTIFPDLSTSAVSSEMWQTSSKTVFSSLFQTSTPYNSLPPQTTDTSLISTAAATAAATATAVTATATAAATVTAVTATATATTAVLSSRAIATSIPTSHHTMHIQPSSTVNSTATYYRADRQRLQNDIDDLGQEVKTLTIVVALLATLLSLIVLVAVVHLIMKWRRRDDPVTMDDGGVDNMTRKGDLSRKQRARNFFDRTMTTTGLDRGMNRISTFFGKRTEASHGLEISHPNPINMDDNEETGFGESFGKNPPAVDKGASGPIDNEQERPPSFIEVNLQ